MLPFAGKAYAVRQSAGKREGPRFQKLRVQFHPMQVWLHNIGPIRDAKVEFAPMTMLIGPNGSGKTTLTNVVYSLLNSHRHALREAIRLADNPFLAEAPTPRGDALLGAMRDRWLEAWTENLESELQRCCSPDLHDLRRARRGGQFAGPRIGLSCSRWNVVFRLDTPTLELDHERVESPSIEIEEGASFDDSISQIRAAFLGDLPLRAVYLPAGRSGIVNSQAALGRLMGYAISTGAFQDATVGSIPGATADLMQLLAQIKPGSASPRSRAAGRARRIEREIARGSVRLDIDGEQRSVFFRPDGYEHEWEVQNMATSVSELVPLVLYLKHGYARGDALLIDEPEAHLHPENQAKLAPLLLDLSGVVHPLVVATHSDLVAAALSNEMLSRTAAHQTQPPELRLYEFGFHDTTDRGLGVDVWEHEYDPSEGFDVGQFSSVTEAVFEDGIDRFNASRSH